MYVLYSQEKYFLVQICIFFVLETLQRSIFIFADAYYYIFVQPSSYVLFPVRKKPILKAM